MEPPEEEAERRGLPDGWVYDDNNWCLLIESKIGSRLSADQLQRHFNTATRSGFTSIWVLAIEARPSKIGVYPWLQRRTWSEVYLWLVENRGSSVWPHLALDYFETLERKLSDSGHLREGNLTAFTGIPFSPENPYNYSEAKRLFGRNGPKAVLSRVLEENNQYFQRERDKLDAWAHDQLVSAEAKLEDTRARLKESKKQARLAASVDEQKSAQEGIKQLERLQRRQRQEIFDVEDEIEARRDSLIDALEKQMHRHSSSHQLFRIRWTLV